MQAEILTEDMVGVSIHEPKLTPKLARCPVQLTAGSQRLLKGAILSALYGRSEPPQTHDLNLAAVDGATWRVEVEPFSEKLAYTFWVRL